MKHLEGIGKNMEAIEQKWEEILLTLKREFDLSDLAFKSWIAPLKIDHIENNTLYIPCEEQITASYIAKKYSKPLSVVIEEITGKDKEGEYITRKVTVTKGVESDYYVEISGSKVKEGMEIIVPKAESKSIFDLMQESGAAGGM